MKNKKLRKGYTLTKSFFGVEIEIPEEWEINKLSNIGKIITGSTPSTSNRKYYGNEILWATPSDLGKKYILDTVTKLSIEGFKQTRELPANTILVTCIGIIGKTGITTESMSTNQQINSIICYKNNFEFIYYQIYFNRDKIKNLANQAVVPILNKTDFGSVKILIPPLPEQQKIASILSNVDALIERTQEIIEKTERLKKGLMQQLLTRGIGHKKFKKVKGLFGKEIEIPREWEIKQIGEIFEFLRTGTNSRKDLGNGNYQYIHYGDIHTKWNRVLDCNIHKIPYIDKSKINNIPFLVEGDLIIADASEDHEGSGASILLKNIKKRKIISGLHTIALRDNNKNTALEFRAYLTSIKFVKLQIIAYVAGISVYGLSKKNLSKIIIPLPSISEQTKIASILSGVDALLHMFNKFHRQVQSSPR